MELAGAFMAFYMESSVSFWSSLLLFIWPPSIETLTLGPLLKRIWPEAERFVLMSVVVDLWAPLPFFLSSAL